MFKDITRSVQQQDETQIKELTKNEEALKHKIRSILKQYETLKEWSDLGQWQLKLLQVLQDHPCGYLPKKRLFCKRLAQCLSPVWNKSIHECALQMYDLILHNLTTQKNSKNPNYQLIDDLPLFSLGLLPFFGVSSQQCKPKVLEILQKYYYPLGPQLMPLMGGIISSVIVGMEDTNEEMMKKVLNSLDMACECVGVKSFYGALWMSIVRSSRTRLGAFKFLNKRWNKTKQKDIEDYSNENLSNQQINDIFESTTSIMKSSQSIQLQRLVGEQDKMPNKSALVINALLASLEDESSLIKRGALDFLSSFARIEDGVFAENENLLLVQGCLLLFMKIDHAVVRRINNWFFSDADLNDTEKLRQNQIIKFITLALNRILEEFKSEPIIDENQQNNTPLKIIQNWYMQHPELVELTLQEIGYQLVKYMYKNRLDPHIQKASERLVESIASNCDLILESLFSLLQTRIQEVKVDQVLELVRLIKYALNVLMQNHFAAEIKEDGDFEPYRQRTLSIQKLINLILSQLNQIPPKEIYKFNLVESVLEIVLSSLDHIEKRVVILNQYKKQQQLQEEINKNDILILERINFSKYQEVIDSYSRYYIEINKYSLDNAQQIQQDGKIIIFQYMSKILIKTQLFIMRQLDIIYEVLPQWVYTLMTSLQCENPLISIASIETLIEILKQDETHENIKKLSHLLTVNCNNNIKPLDELKALFLLQKIDSNPNYDTNYMMDVFQRLWSLLDYHYQDSKVIDLILYFSKNFPIIFTFVIESQFLLNESELDTVIRRYQIFCRLTNPHFRKFSHENKGVGVLMMLNYLQHENPLMRHAAKTWLSETAPFFFRILDPLIERLIVQQVQGLPIYGDLTGYTYQHEFNIELVMETIKKLDLLLNNIKDWYIPYLQNAKISKIIQDKLRNQPSFGLKDINDITYLDIILIILDRFICGTAWEQASPVFQKDNSRLNAICCEQFEAIYSNITTIQSKANVFMKYIQSQLLFLKTLIIRGDLVMQIQILNLVKAYVFSVKEVESVLVKVQKIELQKILTDKHFIQNMVNGLNNSKVFLLKSRYLNTIILSIYSVSEILPPSMLTDNVYLILNTLLALLREHPYNQDTFNRKLNQVDDFEEFFSSQSASMRRLSNYDYAQSQFFSNKNKEWKFNDFQTADLKYLANQDKVIEHNDMPIISSLSGENFEEIMTLSNSIKALLAYFFQYKDEIKDINDQSQQKNLIGGLLVDILTLNMLKFREKQAAANKYKQPVQVQQPQFIQFQGTSQMILKNMDLILKSFLQCWHLGNNIIYQEYFSSKGCIMYEFQKFEQLTESLFDQYNKLGVDLTDDKQIKQNILSILNPCACQFTTEFANACLDVWASEYSSEFYAEPIYNKNMYKLIELLAFLMIEPDEFITALMKSSRYAVLSNFYTNKLPQKKGIFLVCQQQALQENTFLFFIYVYLSINLTHNKDKLIKLWLTTLSMTKPLLASRHLNTLCWILELIYMMAWKYSPKEALYNNELRKELHLQIKTILITLSDICAEKSKFTLMTADYKQGFIATLHSNGPFKINVPFTPSIYELYLEYMGTVSEEGEKNEEMYQLQWIQRIIFDPLKVLGEDLNPDNFQRKCSLIAFKTLKRLAYITLINTYEANKGERIVIMTKEFMSPLLQLMGNNTIEGQQIIIESVSELLHSLLKNQREQYTKEFKKQILDIFNRTDFFICSKRALKYWKEIIDFSSEKGELLADQLGGGGGISIFTVFSGFATLFSSKNQETIKKIKTFERVCFIIYSGAVDKYQQNINIIIDAILNAMKDISKQPPAIIVLIIFCIRILILRLSPQTLNEIFRKIWPSLVSMLMEIFNVKKNQQADANVLLAGLKLVELFSLYQLEEFFFYQWMFVFDYFGITIDMKPNQQQEEQNKIVDIQQPFQYTPCIAKQFPINGSYIINYENQIFADQVQNGNARKKRLVIIKDPFVEDSLEVQRQAVFLCQYFIDINQQRVEFNPQQLENLIEEEFIKLDDYIFNI